MYSMFYQSNYVFMLFLWKFLWKFICIVYELHFSFAWFVQIFNCFICFSFHSRTFVFNFHFHFRTSALPNLRPLSIWLCFVLTTPIWPGLFLLILFLFILYLTMLSFLLLILYCLSTLQFLVFLMFLACICCTLGNGDGA